MRAACLLLTIAACGRHGFETPATDDASVIIDGAIAPPCGSTVVLDDQFTDATPAPLFTSYTNNGMSVAEGGGVVSFVFAADVGAGRYSGYETASMVTTVDVCAVVDAVEVPMSEGLGYFHLFGNTQKIEFIAYRGNLELRTVETQTINSIGVFLFDPVAHRFWRLRQQGGVTYWDVSADGAQFVPLANHTFFTTTMARVAIGAGAVGTTTNGGRFTVQRMLITQP